MATTSDGRQLCLTALQDHGIKLSFFLLLSMTDFDRFGPAALWVANHFSQAYLSLLRRGILTQHRNPTGKLKGYPPFARMARTILPMTVCPLSFSLHPLGRHISVDQFPVFSALSTLLVDVRKISLRCIL